MLPRTLAQLACQDFKKEPPDSNIAVLSPQYSYASHFLHQIYFGSIVGAHVSFWPRYNPSSLPACPKSLLQGDCSNTLVMPKTCHAVKLMEASSMIPRMLSHALKSTAGGSQILPRCQSMIWLTMGLMTLMEPCQGCAFLYFLRMEHFQNHIFLYFI